VGTDARFWRGVDEGSVHAAVDAIRAVNPAIVAVSGHDGSDWNLAEFERALGRRYSPSPWAGSC
jgi:7,8-dihydropterin-6-yl-methyl-4-(beta-D-ribofuranosyl)aminobenzene 5'-phosphate synthase